jgi:hypothetical protein
MLAVGVIAAEASAFLAARSSKPSNTVKACLPRAVLIRNGAASAHSRNDSPMNDRLNPKLGRRDLLRVLAVGAAAVTTSGCNPADAEDFPDKRKAHYQADSAEVQTFYRVNRYPAK